MASLTLARTNLSLGLCSAAEVLPSPPAPGVWCAWMEGRLEVKQSLLHTGKVQMDHDEQCLVTYSLGCVCL